MGRFLDFEDHVRVVGEAAAGLVRRAESAGLDAPVPTCPRWTVDDLVAHQGMVHRWAAAQLRGDDSKIPSKQSILRDVPAAELIGWFRDGADRLVQTLRRVPPDVQAMVFLRDAPAPRDFWARRQAHETTIHGIDALGATLGRQPTAAEAAVERALALDGIDELVCGFVPRGKSGLVDGEAYTLSIAPRDAEPGWTLNVGPDDTVVTETRRRPHADAVFEGSAAQLYLGMWNRGDEITATGPPGVLERWRRNIKIRW